MLVWLASLVVSALVGNPLPAFVTTGLLWLVCEIFGRRDAY